jgi:chondroitin AC lyase
VIGAETCNSENMQGRHLGDGTLLLYRDGSEYEDINPLWDWRRLPGTTCDQGMDELTPRGVSGEFGGADFSGVIGDELTGIAAMIYKRDSLSARKATFMFDDHIVCLGSGISGETIGAVYTSVEQSHLKGEVSQSNEWILHNGTAYQFISGQPELRTKTIAGNWSLSFPTRGDRPVSGEVFSLWIDHGKSPVAENYAYRIFPRIPSGDMDFLQLNDSSSVLMNSEIVQAVENDGKVYAVFYEAGELKSSGIQVSGPCLLIVSNETLLVADPTHSLRTLDVSMEGSRVTVELPQGAEQGKTVKVHDF